MGHGVDHVTVIDQIAIRRGGVRHIFDRIEPRRTAHIVVDMQNGFLAPGAPVEVPAARDIVEQVNCISKAVRAAGGTNIFLRFTSTDDPANWSVQSQFAGAAAASQRESFRRGADSWQLWPELDVLASDLVLDKTRFGAFIPGTCELKERLDALRLDTLLITGTLSNCCCESTARDAMQLNYKVILIADANAAPSDAEHAATLFNLGWLFADLRTTEEVVAMLRNP